MHTAPRLLTVLVGAALLAGGTAPARGFTLQPATAAQQALINHHTNNDPGWTLLAQARVQEDKGRGVLNAAFGAGLQSLAGKPFRISGYMTPLEDSARTRHFIVTRRDTTCPFCPPNTPTEAIEVRLQSPIVFTREQVVVSGRLELVTSSGQGLFFRLDDGAVVAGRG